MAMQDSRPLPNFPPTVWGCSFASFTFSQAEYESYTKEVESLKEEVKEMLKNSANEVTQTIQLINLLCRLGLSYHFEDEIGQQLGRIFDALPKIIDNHDFDLYMLALMFRVLRQYGYKMPCDVFEKFKDENGEFKKTIAGDVKGLLSLYEATFLSVHGEDILDEAVEFTRQHLEILAKDQSPHFAEHIKKALNRPFHYGLNRIEALEYIPFYEKEESRNETLLKFAKLDYNRLQMLYRKELALLSRWWKDTRLVEELPHIRDRMVEVYSWKLGSHFEPQYSYARVLGGKYSKMTSVLDDTYDSYGTIDELQRFTSAFQRCSADAIDGLPNYMKAIYGTFLNLFSETENDENEEIRRRTSYAKEKFKELARHYLIETTWETEGIVPPFEEYANNGRITSTGYVLASSSFTAMCDLLGLDQYEWIKTKPRLVQSSMFIGRLLNDILPHEVEKERSGDCPLGLKSFMKEFGLSREEGIEGIKKWCTNAWKDINEESMKPKNVPRLLIDYYANQARNMYFVYDFVDLYTHSTYMKDVVSKLYIEPMPM